MIISTKSYPRAALIGNPSDGYFGKTIAFTFTNFSAEVVLYESPEIEIVPNDKDHSRFQDIHRLVIDVNRYGYYGGIRLIKAAIKKFHDHCEQKGFILAKRNFTIRYTSNIPHGLGLAGSSAIITAAIRAMMSFYAIDIPKPLLANLVLAVETEELGISAGLQDRVAQVYQGIVYMNFGREIMEKQGYGAYEYLDASKLPLLYVAFKTDLAEGSEKTHASYRSRYTQKDERFFDAVKRWAELTDTVKDCLQNGKGGEIGRYLNENFDLRNSVQQVNPGNLEMIETARSAGASAKFTGSGGAIIGTYEDEKMYRKLQEKFSSLDIDIIKPRIVST